MRYLLHEFLDDDLYSIGCICGFVSGSKDTCISTFAKEFDNIEVVDGHILRIERIG